MPDPTLLLAVFDFLAFFVICHVIGTAILAVVPVTVRGVVPPYALFGSAALALQLWVFGFAHIPWNAATLLLPWIVAWIVILPRLRVRLRAQLACAAAIIRRLPGIDPLSGGLAAISMLLVGIYLLNSILHPIWGWDAVAFWAFKARLFFFDQHVDPASPALRAVPHILAVRNQEYPPLFPLMLASTYVFSGRVNESLGNAINLVSLLAVLPTLLSALRQLLGIRLAAALGFLFVALPAAYPIFIDGIYLGYADYIEACWILLALLYLQMGSLSDNTADVLAVACAAGAALTKDEGTPLLVFLVGVLIVRRACQWRRNRAMPPVWQVAIAAACVLPVIIWHFTWSLTGTITPMMLNQHPLSVLPLLPSRALTIVRITASFASRTNTDYWMALTLPLCLVLLAANRFRTGAGVALLVFLQLLAYVAVYLFTPIDIVQHLEASVDRIILQLAPALILLVAVSLAPFLAPPAEAVDVRREQLPASGQSL